MPRRGRNQDHRQPEHFKQIAAGYVKTESLGFTCKASFVNYGNLFTGLENTINPNNTAASITPVFGPVGVPYIRAGVAISF